MVEAIFEALFPVPCVGAGQTFCHDGFTFRGRCFGNIGSLPICSSEGLLRAVYCSEGCQAWNQDIREGGGGLFFSFSLVLCSWPEAARCFTSKQGTCLTMTTP